MQLVEVDIVGLKALQAGIDGGVDMRPGQAAALANMGHPRSGNFGGEDHIVASPALLQPAPDVLLGAPLTLRNRRYGIHLCGIDEIDTQRNGAVELRMGLAFTVLLTKGHGAEAQATDVDAGLAERAGLHNDSWLCWRVENQAREALPCPGQYISRDSLAVAARRALPRLERAMQPCAGAMLL